MTPMSLTPAFVRRAATEMPALPPPMMTTPWCAVVLMRLLAWWVRTSGTGQPANDDLTHPLARTP